MSKTFEGYWNSDEPKIELLQSFSKDLNKYSKDVAHNSWNASRKGMVPLDEVIEKLYSKTDCLLEREELHQAVFEIEQELKQKYGGE